MDKREKLDCSNCKELTSATENAQRGISVQTRLHSHDHMNTGNIKGIRDSSLWFLCPVMYVAVMIEAERIKRSAWHKDGGDEDDL